MKKPDIGVLGTNNYKFYVNDWMRQNGLSVRGLGKLLGITSYSYLDALSNTNSKKNASPATVDKLVKLMKLNKKEELFFRLLVTLERTTVMNSQQKEKIRNGVWFWITKY